MQTQLSCEAGQQVLEQTAGVIGSDVYKYTVQVNPYTSIVPQKNYNLSGGANQRYTVIGRPDLVEGPWAPVGVTDPVAGTTRCETPLTEIGLNGVDTKSPLFYEKELKTPNFCYEDIINGADTVGAETLAAYIEGFKTRTDWEFYRFHQRGIFLGSGIKGVADNVQGLVATYSDSATTYPAQAPTAPISLGLLEGLVQALDDNGADADPYDTLGGVPLYPVYLSYEAMFSLLRSDPQLRKDLRYSDQANTLIGPLKKAMGLGRLSFMQIKKPRRFTFVNGVGFTEVLPYIKSGTDALGRTKTINNPNYTNQVTAPFEEVQIPNKNSYVALIPNSNLKPPAGMDFPDVAKTYRGEWHFKVPDLIPCPTITNGNVTAIDLRNNRENQGYFWAYFKMGQAFPQPGFSASFLIQRCPFGPVAASCNAAGY
jgi:hypothetical protein